MTIIDYINYWKNLIASHKHIKKFYRLNPTEVNDDLQHDIIYPYFILNDYEGEIRTEDNGNKFYDVQKCSFILTDNIPINDFDDEHNKLSQLKKWGIGLLAKVYNDLNISFIECPLSPYMLDINSIRYYITDFEKEHNKGVVFEFDLIDYQFEFTYDANDFL